VEEYIAHPHAGRRWAERVAGIPERDVTAADVRHGCEAVVLAMATARPVVRYGATKRRVFITPEGIHLLVAPGSVVLTTMRPGWIIAGCPCDACLAKRAEKLRSGDVDQGRHGVLSRIVGFNYGNRHARRRNQGGKAYVRRHARRRDEGGNA